MRVSFHGAARGVTGSCHLIEVAGKRVLVDCGMFQGRHELDEDNAGDFGFNPASIDLLLLTHAHLDHCGRIPLLVKRGFAGEIVTTDATRDLARLVMLDSAHIQEEDARRSRRHGGAHAQPLYDAMDALDAMERFGRVARYDTPIQLAEGLRATFVNAGHILGSASILIEADGKRVLFSGDLGAYGRPLLGDPVTPAKVDAVVMETTYGDRDHRPYDASAEEFLAAVADARARGGNVIIPTFALERAQEVLWVLREGEAAGKLADDVQVFLDSPMAISATRIFGRHPEALRPEIAAMIAHGDDPFWLPGLSFTRDAADSREINGIRSGAVIMAGSGMATGGRVRHHLRHNLPHGNCSVIFVGYAAEGTLARIIIDGAKQVKLFGREVNVNARIHTINGFSAHAGASDLLRWHAASEVSGPTFLVHGEPRSMQALAKRISGRVETPELHQAFEI